MKITVTLVDRLTVDWLPSLLVFYLGAVRQSEGWWPPWGRGGAAGSSWCWRSRSGCVSWRSAAPRVGSASPEQTTTRERQSEDVKTRTWTFSPSLIQATADTDLQTFLQEALSSLQTVRMLVGVTPVSDQEHQSLYRRTHSGYWSKTNNWLQVIKGQEHSNILLIR